MGMMSLGRITVMLDVQLGSKGRLGSSHLWINRVHVKGVMPLTHAILRANPTQPMDNSVPYRVCFCGDHYKALY